MTTSTHSRFAADVRAICVLAAPLIGNNLSVIGMQFADTVMAGQLGARDLAALAVGVGYYHLFLLLGFGMLMAVSPSVAHAFGANDKRAVTRYCRQAWWLALAMAVLLVTGLMQVDRVLPALGIAPEILPTAIGYVHAMAWGMPALLAFFSLRYTSEGLGRTKPIMYFGFLGLTANVIGNWIFMYGKFGIGMCATVMAMSAVGIVLFNDGIANLYTRDPAVRDIAAGLLLLAAIFQLSDGVQVGAAGALRGFKDTAIPMTMCIFSYWVVGFPLAYVFGVRQGGGPLYVWIGFIAGLTVSAVLLVSRYLYVSRRPLPASAVGLGVS